MTEYTQQELAQALGAIDSIIHKCEKAQEKFPYGSSHHTLLKNRLKAMYISKALITEALVKSTQQSPEDSEERIESPSRLIENLEQLHTTDLGADRIKVNLQLNVNDVVLWCREKIQSPGSRIVRKGKNWYIAVDGCEITVNAHSYTIITAHKKREVQA